MQCVASNVYKYRREVSASEPLGGEPLFRFTDPVAAEDDLTRRGLDVRGHVGQVRGKVALQGLRGDSARKISIHLSLRKKAGAG